MYHHHHMYPLFHSSLSHTKNKLFKMERKKYLSRNLKHHSLNKIHHNHPSWDNCSSECESNSSTTFVDLVAAGGRFSWPPRSYTCSFCKREFRSAQALGGHMNVHRRDRARLRQSSPQPPLQLSSENHHYNSLNLNLNPNPNPNPNPNVSLTSSALGPSLSLVNGDRFDLAKMKTDKTIFRFEGFEEDRLNKCGRVRLDLEIGIGMKEDLDLELRLGYS